MKMDMKNIMDIKKNMAKRVVLTVTRSGDTKKERVIKLLKNVLT